LPRFVRTAVPAALVLLSAAPALADHGAAGTGPSTSGPIVGNSAGTLGAGKAALSLDFALAEPDHRSDAELAALAGQHIHAHDQADGQVWTVSAAYGLTDDVTLSLALPYVRRADIREGAHTHIGGVAVNGVDERGSSAGLGDASLLAKWRVTGENHHGWEAALIGGLKLPTGATHQVDDLGERFEAEHQPGTGSWDPVAGVALTRALPRGGFHASALYQLSTRGSQATRLGDRAQAALGVTHRLIGAPTDHHAEEHHADAEPALSLDGVLELNGEWEGRQRVTGAAEAESGGRALFLSPGLRLNTGGWSIAVGGSLPLAQHIRLSHSENAYRLRLGVSRGF
jgi:hypothetical protein